MSIPFRTPVPPIGGLPPALSPAGMMHPGGHSPDRGEGAERSLVLQVIGLMALCVLACFGAGQLRKHAAEWAYSIQPSFHGGVQWSWVKAFTGGVGLWLLVVLLATLIASTCVDDTPTRLGVGFFAGSFSFGNVIWQILFAFGDGTLPHFMWSWPAWILGWGLDALFLTISALFAAFVAGRALVGLLVSIGSCLVLWGTYFLAGHGHASFVLKGVVSLGFLWPHLLIAIMVGIGASVMLHSAPPLPPPFTITGGYATVYYSPEPYRPPVPEPYRPPAPVPYGQSGPQAMQAPLSLHDRR